MAQQRITSDPERPSLRNPQISPPVDSFILSLLKRRPDDRPQSAGEAIEQISKLPRS